MDITRGEERSAQPQRHATRAAAYEHDFVALPADPIEELIPTLSREEEAGELTLLFVGAHHGTPVSTIRLSIPTLDNLTTVNLEITVHPLHRRLGFGRAALQFGIDESRRRGLHRLFLAVPSREDGADRPARSRRGVGGGMAR